MSVRSWAEYQRGLLLGGRWLPVTGCVLFVKASAQRCVDKLTTGGRARVVMEVYGHPQRIRPVRAGNLEDSRIRSGRRCSLHTGGGRILTRRWAGSRVPGWSRCA